MSNNTDEMYQNKFLIIPDYVSPIHLDKIYNYFDYYNIADVKEVTYHNHPDPQYIYEDPPYYGYAVIEINHWYKNNGSLSFYESIINNKCKMVYDDPLYWELQFYNNSTNTSPEVNISLPEQVPPPPPLDEIPPNPKPPPLVRQNATIEPPPLVRQNTTIDVTCINNNVSDDNSYNNYDNNIVNEILNSPFSDPFPFSQNQYNVDNDSNSNADSGSDNEEEVETYEDYYYEHIYPFVVKINDQITSQNKFKNETLRNLTIKDIQVKKNKTKAFKNVWSRRLRQRCEL